MQDVVSMLAGVALTIVAILIITAIVILVLLALHGKQRGWGGKTWWAVRKGLASWIFLAVGLAISFAIVVVMILRFQVQPDWQTVAMGGIALAILVIIIWILAQFRMRGKVYWTERGAIPWK